jgi:glucosamine-6-phosphate deaminase
MLTKQLQCEKMQVEIYDTRLAMGRAAAEAISAEIKRMIAREGKAAIILASAPSQNEFLQALREDTTIAWERITAFHLDEYVGVSDSHPTSFRRFVKDRLLNHVPIKAFHGLEGQADDLGAECKRYAALLEQEKPGLAILGIGENGHLAFINPPFCDFNDPANVRTVELDQACRQQQVNDGGVARLEDVPKTALSMTIPYLLSVPRAVAIVPGPAKRFAIKAVIDGPVATACPASILRQHPNATLYIDKESAALLKNFAG